MKTFAQTSNTPYNRHTYRLHLQGLDARQRTIDFDDYQLVQSHWFSTCRLPHYLDYIEVLDRPLSKGFK